MFKKLFFFLSLCLYAHFSIATHDVQSSIISLIYYLDQDQTAHEDILVVFDLDNMIFQPKTEIGSDQWLEYMAKQKAANGMDLAQVYDDLLPFYYRIQYLIDLELVEDITADIIYNLKLAGIKAIGLTTRSKPIIERTLSELSRLDVFFSSLSEETIMPGFNPKYPHPMYKDGVIFCSNNHKGKVLFEYLKFWNTKPKKIYFFDDKIHHLEKVKESAFENGVDCTCIHYTGSKHRVDNFDIKKADNELLELKGAYANLP